jgi:pilus assembly protein CpaF
MNVNTLPALIRGDDEGLLDVGVDVDAARRELTEEVRATFVVEATEDLDRLTQHARDERFGLGLIDALTQLDGVTEVMVNPDGSVWVERWGDMHSTPHRLQPEQRTIFVERAIRPLGIRFDHASPIADARLANGDRLHAVGPPVSPGGIALTVRRHRTAGFALADWEPCASVLGELLDEQANVLVVGATGSGKTSVLGALLSAAHPAQRIVCVEDTLEVACHHPNVVRLEARSSNADGYGSVTLRDLVRASLRMRPDRLVVGEARGPEALDLLLALHCGHRGSMATLHAHGADEAIDRLVALALLADRGVSERALTRMATSSIDVVIVVEKVGAERVISRIDRRASSGWRAIYRLAETLSRSEPCL